MTDPVVVVAVAPPLPVAVALSPELDDVSVPLVVACAVDPPLVLADVLVIELVVLPPVVAATVLAAAVFWVFVVLVAFVLPGPVVALVEPAPVVDVVASPASSDEHPTNPEVMSRAPRPTLMSCLM